VLVSTSGDVKLTDFGCSHVMPEDVCTPRGSSSSGNSCDVRARKLDGTVPFMAPEVIRQTGRGPKSDIWSVGCLLIEMATGSAPWMEFSNKLSAMYHVASKDVIPTIPSGLSSECVSFLSRCLCREMSVRATASELLSHPWLLSNRAVSRRLW
jgi:serine/threonine protein kinase